MIGILFPFIVGGGIIGTLFLLIYVAYVNDKILQRDLTQKDFLLFLLMFILGGVISVVIVKVGLLNGIENLHSDYYIFYR